MHLSYIKVFCALAKVPIWPNFEASNFAIMSDKSGILKFLKLDSVIDNLQGLVDTKLELLKLELKDEASNAFSKLATTLVIVFLALNVLLFLSITVALYLGILFGSYFYGFGIVTAFYAILLIIVWLLKAKFGLEDKLRITVLRSLNQKKNDE